MLALFCSSLLRQPSDPFAPEVTMTGSRRASLLLLAAGIAACGEAKSPLTPGGTTRVSSMMAHHDGGGIAPTGTCSFSSITTLVGRYFGSTEARAVKTLVSSMQQAKAGTTAAQGIGFDILVHVANNVKAGNRSEEHTSELQSHVNLVCRLLLEKKKQNSKYKKIL